MTDYLKIAYLNSGGVLCPYCKSDDIEEYDIDHPGGGTAYTNCRCHICDRCWRDEYTLTDVYLEEDEI